MLHPGLAWFSVHLSKCRLTPPEEAVFLPRLDRLVQVQREKLNGTVQIAEGSNGSPTVES